MRISKSMRLASVLFIATMISMYIYSGTLAKYTSGDSGSDTARVAKWGVEVQVDGNLYGDTYKDTIVNGDTFTVKSSETVSDINSTLVDVVAPGTKNEEGLTFSLKGQPEVDCKVTSVMKIQNIFLGAGSYGVMIPVNDGVVTEENFDEFGTLYKKGTDDCYTVATGYEKNLYTLEDFIYVEENYYPVEYTLTGDTKCSGDEKVNVLEKIAERAIGYTEKYEEGNMITTYVLTMEFPSNFDLVKCNVSNLRLTWKWDFCQQKAEGADGDECTAENYADACWHCKADTILGNLMAKKGAATGDITSEVVNCTVDEETGVVTSCQKLVLGTKDEKKDCLVFVDGNMVTPVACLQTSFGIDFTVTQID